MQQNNSVNGPGLVRLMDMGKNFRTFVEERCQRLGIFGHHTEPINYSLIVGITGETDERKPPDIEASTLSLSGPMSPSKPTHVILPEEGNIEIASRHSAQMPVSPSKPTHVILPEEGNIENASRHSAQLLASPSDLTQIITPGMISLESFSKITPQTQLPTHEPNQAIYPDVDNPSYTPKTTVQPLLPELKLNRTTTLSNEASLVTPEALNEGTTCFFNPDFRSPEVSSNDLSDSVQEHKRDIEKTLTTSFNAEFQRLHLPTPSILEELAASSPKTNRARRASPQPRDLGSYISYDELTPEDSDSPPHYSQYEKTHHDLCNHSKKMETGRSSLKIIGTQARKLLGKCSPKPTGSRSNPRNSPTTHRKLGKNLNEPNTNDMLANHLNYKTLPRDEMMRIEIDETQLASATCPPSPHLRKAKIGLDINLPSLHGTRNKQIPLQLPVTTTPEEPQGKSYDDHYGLPFNSHIDSGFKETNGDQKEGLVIHASEELSYNPESVLKRLLRPTSMKEGMNQEDETPSTGALAPNIYISLRSWLSRIKHNTFTETLLIGPMLSQGSMTGRVPRGGDLIHLRISARATLKLLGHSRNQGWIVVRLGHRAEEDWFEAITMGNIQYKTMVKLDKSLAWEYWSNLLDIESKNTRIRRNFDRFHPHNKLKLCPTSNWHKQDLLTFLAINWNIYPTLTELRTLIDWSGIDIKVFENIDESCPYVSQLISIHRHGRHEPCPLQDAYNPRDTQTEGRAEDPQDRTSRTVSKVLALSSRDSEPLQSLETIIRDFDPSDIEASDNAELIKEIIQLENRALKHLREISQCIDDGDFDNAIVEWSSVLWYIRECLERKNRLRSYLQSVMDEDGILLGPEQEIAKSNFMMDRDYLVMETLACTQRAQNTLQKDVLVRDWLNSQASDPSEGKFEVGSEDTSHLLSLSENLDMSLRGSPSYPASIDSHALLSNIDKSLSELLTHMQGMQGDARQEGEPLISMTEPLVEDLLKEIQLSPDPGNTIISPSSNDILQSSKEVNIPHFPRRSQRTNQGNPPPRFKDYVLDNPVPELSKLQKIEPQGTPSMNESPSGAGNRSPLGIGPAVMKPCNLSTVCMANESGHAKEEQKLGKETLDPDSKYKELTNRMIVLERSLSAFGSLDIAESRLGGMEYTDDPFRLGAPSLARQLYPWDQTGTRPRTNTGVPWGAGNDQKGNLMHQFGDIQRSNEQYNVPLPHKPDTSAPQPSATEHKISTSDYLKGASQTPEDDESANPPQAKTKFIIFKLLRLRKEADYLKTQLMEGLEASLELQQPTETSHKRFEEFTKQYAALQKRHDDLVGDTLDLESVPQQVFNSMEYLDNMNTEIEGILAKLKKRCSSSFSQTGSITNVSYIKLDKLDLEKWTGPILFETVKKWEEIQMTSCGTSLPAQKCFLEKCINSISDASITIDIRQNCQPTNLKQLVNHLINNYGKPARIQSILVKKHLSLKKIEWPLTESNSEQTYEATKIHIAVMNSAESMIIYFEKTYGVEGASILLQDGIYAKEYFTILANLFPTALQSKLKYTLSTITPKAKFYEVRNQFIRLKEESHNLTVNWSTQASVTQSQNKSRLMMANLDPDSTPASRLAQPPPPRYNGPNNQSSLGNLQTQGQSPSQPTWTNPRQATDTNTDVTDADQFNRWLVTNFENLLEGEPINFKRMDGMDSLVPNTVIQHIPEPRRKAILSLMGKRVGCPFCLKLIEMSPVGDKQAIFPHIITYKPRATIRIARGIRYCPMVLHLSLPDRLKVFKEIEHNICRDCLAYTPPDKSYPCRNCSMATTDNRKILTCRACRCHVFLCGCGDGLAETQRFQRMYIEKLKPLLKNPLNNSCIVGLPDPRIYCLAITRTLFPDQALSSTAEPLWQNPLPESSRGTTAPTVRSCHRCTLRLDLGENPISGSTVPDHQLPDALTHTHGNVESPHLHDWDRVESCIAEVTRCLSTLKKSSLMTRNVMESPRNMALCYKKPHLLFDTKEQLLASSTRVSEKSSGTNMFLSFYIIGEDHVPRLFIWDSGASDTIILKSLPGKAFKAQFIAKQNIEVASGAQLTTDAYNILLPLKTQCEPNDSQSRSSTDANYVLSRALTLKSIITEIPVMSIRSQVDEAYNEYARSRQSNSLPLEFTRDQCPNTYGGKPSGLIPMKIFHPQLLFSAKNGICFYKTPFLSGPRPNIAVGGVLQIEGEATTSLLYARPPGKHINTLPEATLHQYQNRCMQIVSKHQEPFQSYNVELLGEVSNCAPGTYHREAKNQRVQSAEDLYNQTTQTNDHQPDPITDDNPYQTGPKATIVDYQRSKTLCLITHTASNESTDSSSNMELQSKPDIGASFLNYTKEDDPQEPLIQHDTGVTNTLPLGYLPRLKVDCRKETYPKREHLAWMHETRQQMSETTDKDDIANFLQRILYPIEMPCTCLYNCKRCMDCTDCHRKNKLSGEKLLDAKYEEDLILQKCVSLSTDLDGTKRVVCRLPVDEQAAAVVLKGSNYDIVSKEWKAKIAKLTPSMKADIQREFMDLLDRGFIIPINILPDSLRDEILDGMIKYFISPSPAYKKDSKTTSSRVAWNSSKTNARGVSLNQLLPCGLTKPNLPRSFRKFRYGRIGFVTDISKFFNNLFLSSDSLKYNLCIWQSDLDQWAPENVYVLTRLFYGLTSSSRMAQLGILLIAEEAVRRCQCTTVQKTEDYVCQDLSHKFLEIVEDIYVDDIMSSVDDQHLAIELRDYSISKLAEYQFSVKGWSISTMSNRENPNKSVDEEGKMSLGGYIYYPESDQISIKCFTQTNGRKFRGALVNDKTRNIKLLHGGKKRIVPPELVIEDFCEKEVNIDNLKRVYKGCIPTYRLILSRAMQIFDQAGYCTPLLGQVSSTVRDACIQAKGNYEAEISIDLFNHFLECLLIVLKASKYKYPRVPRFKHPLLNLKKLVVCTDAAMSQVTMAYLVHQTDHSEYVPHLIAGNSVLTPKNLSIPRAELSALSIGAKIFNTLKSELKGKISESFLCTDSVVTIFWSTKWTERYGDFVKNRGNIIRSNSNPHQELFWLRSQDNPADIGTRYRQQGNDHRWVTEESCSPESEAFNGKSWMRNIDSALRDRIIVPALEVIESFGSTANEDSEQVDKIIQDYTNELKTKKKVGLKKGEVIQIVQKIGDELQVKNTTVTMPDQIHTDIVIAPEIVQALAAREVAATTVKDLESKPWCQETEINKILAVNLSESLTLCAQDRTSLDSTFETDDPVANHLEHSMILESDDSEEEDDDFTPQHIPMDDFLSNGENITEDADTDRVPGISINSIPLRELIQDGSNPENEVSAPNSQEGHSGQPDTTSSSSDQPTPLNPDTETRLHDVGNTAPSDHDGDNYSTPDNHNKLTNCDNDEHLTSSCKEMMGCNPSRLETPKMTKPAKLNTASRSVLATKAINNPNSRPAGKDLPTQQKIEEPKIKAILCLPIVRGKKEILTIQSEMKSHYGLEGVKWNVQENMSCGFLSLNLKLSQIDRLSRGLASAVDQAITNGNGDARTLFFCTVHQLKCDDGQALSWFIAPVKGGELTLMRMHHYVKEQLRDLSHPQERVLYLPGLRIFDKEVSPQLPQLNEREIIKWNLKIMSFENLPTLSLNTFELREFNSGKLIALFKTDVEITPGIPPTVVVHPFRSVSYKPCNQEGPMYADKELVIFKHGSLLKRYLAAKLKINKTYYTIYEICELLLGIIEGEQLYDGYNRTMITASPDLEEALGTRFLHQTQLKSMIANQVAPLPFFPLRYHSQGTRSRDSRHPTQLLHPECPIHLHTQPIPTNIPTFDRNARFPVNSTFIEAISTDEDVISNKEGFSYNEIRSIFFKYIEKNHAILFRNYKTNDEVAVIQGTTLGDYLKCQAFHKSQVYKILVNQLKIEVDSQEYLKPLKRSNSILAAVSNSQVPLQSSAEKCTNKNGSSSGPDNLTTHANTTEERADYNDFDTTPTLQPPGKSKEIMTGDEGMSTTDFGLLSVSSIYNKTQGAISEQMSLEVKEAILKRLRLKGNNEILGLDNINYLLDENDMLSTGYDKIVRIHTLAIQAARKFKALISTKDLNIVRLRNPLVTSLVTEGFNPSWQVLPEEGDVQTQGLSFGKFKPKENKILTATPKITQIPQPNKVYKYITLGEKFLDPNTGYHGHLHAKRVVNGIRFLINVIKDTTPTSAKLIPRMESFVTTWVSLLNLLTWNNLNISEMADMAVIDLSTLSTFLINQSLKPAFDQALQHYYNQLRHDLRLLKESNSPLKKWIKTPITENRDGPEDSQVVDIHQINQAKATYKSYSWICKVLEANYTLGSFGIVDTAYLPNFLPRRILDPFPAQCFQDHNYMACFQATALLFAVKVSTETKSFCNSKQLETHVEEVDGFTFSKSRFSNYNSNAQDSIVAQTLQRQNYEAHIITIESFSPIAWAVSLYHHKNSKTHHPLLKRPSNIRHNGRDSGRIQMDKSKDVFGANAIHAIICKQCKICALRNKRTMQQAEGRVHPHQLVPEIKHFAAFKATYLDIAGPISLNVWSKTMQTRNATKVNMYILIAVCSITRAVALTLLSSTKSGHVALGLLSLASRVGSPLLWLADRQSSFVKLAKEARWIVSRTNQLKIENLEFSFCPVGGEAHQNHGAVEKRIQLLRQAFGSMNLSRTSLGACEVWSMLHVIEASLNNIPIGLRRCGKKNQAKFNDILHHLITPAMLLNSAHAEAMPLSFIDIENDINEYYMNVRQYKEVTDKFFVTLLTLMIRDSKTTYTPTVPPEIGSVVAFRADVGPHTKVTTPYRLAVITELQKSDTDGQVRQAKVKFLSMPHDKFEGEILDTVRETETFKRIDQLVLICAPDDHSLETEFAKCTRLTVNLLNGIFKSTVQGAVPLREQGPQPENSTLIQPQNINTKNLPDSNHRTESSQGTTTMGQHLHKGKGNLGHEADRPDCLELRTIPPSSTSLPDHTNLSEGSTPGSHTYVSIDNHSPIYSEPLSTQLMGEGSMEDIMTTQQASVEDLVPITLDDHGCPAPYDTADISSLQEPIEQNWILPHPPNYDGYECIQMDNSHISEATMNLHGTEKSNSLQFHDCRKPTHDDYMEMDSPLSDHIYEDPDGADPLITSKEVDPHYESIPDQAEQDGPRRSTRQKKPTTCKCCSNTSLFMFATILAIIVFEPSAAHQIEFTEVGANLTLGCTSLANRAGAIQWFKSSSEIMRPHKVITYGHVSQVTLVNATCKTAGKYIAKLEQEDQTLPEDPLCTYWVFVGGQPVTSLDYQFEPLVQRFWQNVQSRTTTSRLTITCSTEACQETSLVMSKAGYDIRNTSNGKLDYNRTRLYTTPGLLRLVIFDPVKEDLDFYGCHGANVDGETSAFLDLNQLSLSNHIKHTTTPVPPISAKMVKRKVTENMTHSDSKKASADMENLTPPTDPDWDNFPLFKQVKQMSKQSRTRADRRKYTSDIFSYRWDEYNFAKNKSWFLTLNCSSPNDTYMDKISIYKEDREVELDHKIEEIRGRNFRTFRIQDPSKSQLGRYLCIQMNSSLSLKTGNASDMFKIFTLEARAVQFNIRQEYTGGLTSSSSIYIEAQSWISLENIEVLIKKDNELQWLKYLVPANLVNSTQELKLYYGQIVVSNLEPGVVYYIKVRGTNTKTDTLLSDIFTLKSRGEAKSFNTAPPRQPAICQHRLPTISLSLLALLNSHTGWVSWCLLSISLLQTQALALQWESLAQSEWVAKLPPILKSIISPNEDGVYHTHLPQQIIPQGINDTAPKIFAEGTSTRLDCGRPIQPNSPAFFLWTKLNNNSWRSNGRVLELTNLNLADSGIYKCIATQGETVIKVKEYLVKIVDRPIKLLPTPYGNQQTDHITAYDCLSTSSKSKVVNLAQVENCHKNKLAPYSQALAKTVTVLVRQYTHVVQASRCNLNIQIRHASCGRGFLGFRKYSQPHAFVTTSREQHQLTREQCNQAFATGTLYFTLGTTKMELRALLGKSRTETFLHNTYIDNEMTCVGSASGHPIYVSQDEPECSSSSCSGRIVQALFELEMEKEQGVINVQKKTIEFPRLGITADTRHGNFSIFNQQGTFTADLHDLLPKGSCDEFGALQNQVGKLYQVPSVNKSSDTPDILTVEITMLGQETKLVALQLYESLIHCEQKCFKTQVLGLFVCYQNNSPKTLKLNELSNGNIKTLAALGSFGLNHLQLHLSRSIKDIIYDICTNRMKFLQLAVTNFEELGTTVIDSEDKKYKAFERGENGFILECDKVIVQPRHTNSQFCCTNLPVTLIRAGIELQKYITPKEHIITELCDAKTCIDSMPITYYTDLGRPICQVTSGITHCVKGGKLDPNIRLQANHFIPLNKQQSVPHAVNRLTEDHLHSLRIQQHTSINFANTLLNVIQDNVLRCENDDYCKTSSLGYAIQREIARQTSSFTDFNLAYSLFGKACQWILWFIFGWVLGNCLINFGTNIRSNCRHGANRALTCYGAFWILVNSLDASFNPWSNIRMEQSRKLEDLTHSVAMLNAKFQTSITKIDTSVTNLQQSLSSICNDLYPSPSLYPSPIRRNSYVLNARAHD